MGLIRKRDSDFELLDLTLLQKKGIIKFPREEDVLDLRQTVENSATAPTQSLAGTANPFGMLDSLAAAGNSGGQPAGNSDDFNAMKIKLDDFEFKLGKIVERLERIESNLDRLK